MDVFEVESCVRGHHIWTPFVGEELTCTDEIENTKDPFLKHYGQIYVDIYTSPDSTCTLHD